MEEVLNDLSWLSADTYPRTCQLALQYLQGTLDSKSLQAESESLGVEIALLSKTLQSLSFIYTSAVGNQPIEVPDEIKAFLACLLYTSPSPRDS